MWGMQVDPMRGRFYRDSSGNSSACVLCTRAAELSYARLCLLLGARTAGQQHSQSDRAMYEELGSRIQPRASSMRAATSRTAASARGKPAKPRLKLKKLGELREAPAERDHRDGGGEKNSGVESDQPLNAKGGAPIKMTATYKDGWDNERVKICAEF